MLESLEVGYYPIALLLNSCNNIISRGDFKSVKKQNTRNRTFKK